MNRTIITVVGKDTIGIIAKVCTYLADKHINILDISQTIVQGFFNMMMIVDTTAMSRFKMRKGSIHIWPISSWTQDPFFETKQVIYIEKS